MHHTAIAVKDAYTDMVREVASRHHASVTRYTTSAFMRAKLQHALLERGVAPRIFECAADARRHLEMPGRDDGAAAPGRPSR
ncbi:hypothetical protein [Aquabacterium sp.]|uniref:hypothetical protein n=1 Tax=Aquabacterium sp. TaxID=1872578 RepID=UPI002B9F8A68|nr:hypothetical protein [Aquabacterium sp.]HSW06019.1 hypothetical protein [Aquabacterium sp.]